MVKTRVSHTTTVHRNGSRQWALGKGCSGNSHQIRVGKRAAGIIKIPLSTKSSITKGSYFQPYWTHTSSWHSSMQKEVLNMGFASLCQPANLITPWAHELLFFTNLHHIRFVTHWHACCASPCLVLIARHISSIIIIIIILEWPTHKVSLFKLH